MSENGSNIPSAPHLLLTFNPIDFTVVIDGNVANLDMALSMLAQAARHIEQKWRLEKAFEAQAAAQEERAKNERVNKLLQTTLKRN